MSTPKASGLVGSWDPRSAGPVTVCFVFCVQDPIDLPTASAFDARFFLSSFSPKAHPLPLPSCPCRRGLPPSRIGGLPHRIVFCVQEERFWRHIDSLLCLALRSTVQGPSCCVEPSDVLASQGEFLAPVRSSASPTIMEPGTINFEELGCYFRAGRGSLCAADCILGRLVYCTVALLFHENDRTGRCRLLGGTLLGDDGVVVSRTGLLLIYSGQDSMIDAPRGCWKSRSFSFRKSWKAVQKEKKRISSSRKRPNSGGNGTGKGFPLPEVSNLDRCMLALWCGSWRSALSPNEWCGFPVPPPLVDLFCFCPSTLESAFLGLSYSGRQQDGLESVFLPTTKAGGWHCRWWDSEAMLQRSTRNTVSSWREGRANVNIQERSPCAKRLVFPKHRPALC